jgi:hypothetical protein
VSGDQPPPPGWVPPTPPPPGSPPPTPQPVRPGPTPGWGSPPPPAGTPATETGWGQFGPGSPQPGGHPAGYPAPYPIQPTPAAHKPGAIPLRPLGLGDIFDGAFRIIRYNPQATVGAAVLVSAVAMVLPVVTALVSGSTGALRIDPDSSGLTDGQVTSLVATFGSLVLGLELQSVGLLFVSGMIAHVASAAAVGRKLTIGEAWAATHGKRWRLFGMAVLLGLAVVAAFALVAGVLLIGIFAFDSTIAATVVVGIALGLLLVVAYLLFWVRVRALAVPTLMLEPVGVFGALARSVRLTRHQFWRLFGILLLVALVVGFAGGIVRMPFSLAGNLFLTASSGTGYGVTLYVLLTAAGTVLSSAVLQPFQAAVNALLYVDQRIRKEAYDVELLSRAGILPR